MKIGKKQEKNIWKNYLRKIGKKFEEKFFEK